MKDGKEYKRTKVYSQEEVETHKSTLPKSKRFLNLTGEVFGNLKVIKHYQTVKCHTSWFCKCNCGSIILAKTNQLKRGRDRCTECAFKLISKTKRLEVDSLVEEIKTVHPEYKLVDSKGGGNKEKWLWYCPDCNTPFYKSPSRLRETPNKLCRCNTSSNFSGWTEQLRTSQMKEIAKIKGLSFLGWESSYLNSKSYLYVKCPKHKHYKVSVNNFTRDYDINNCPECYDDRRGEDVKHTLEDFVKKGKEIHKGLYNYCDYTYVDSRTSGVIHCNSCGGTFTATYDNHINKKQGCGLCKGKRAKNLYLLLIKDQETPIGLKYGIATFTDERVKGHIKSTGFNFEVIRNIIFEETYQCRLAETRLKRYYGNAGYLPKSIFKGGNTETVSLLNLEEILKIFDELERKQYE